MPSPSSFFQLLRLGVLALACALPAARAHAPGETSLAVSVDEENLLAELSLSQPAVAALLPAEDASSFSFATLDRHRPALLAAAARSCIFLAADGAPLLPERVLLSVRDDHEIRFTFLFPLSARPATIRAPFLASLPGEAFCILSDLRRPTPLRAVLTSRVPEFTLPALTP